MNKKLKKIMLILLIWLFVLGTLFSVSFALYYTINPVIVKGIKYNKVDLSNLTIYEAKEQLIKSGIEEEKANKISSKAYLIGHDGNIFENNYTILDILINGKNIENDIKEIDSKEIEKPLENKKIDPHFNDVLGEFKTEYNSGNTNRSTNIKLAASKINGCIINPGEVFSYNETVGERTIEEGYKDALVYVGGEVANGVGGGICQVSTTLYNACLFANLEIVERTNHSFTPHYVAAGRDATVSWGGPDFKFRNNRNYPVMIVVDNPSRKYHNENYGSQRRY